jgi:hypothetical protein
MTLWETLQTTEVTLRAFTSWYATVSDCDCVVARRSRELENRYT